MPHWESSRNEGPHEQGEKGPPWEWLRQERSMKGEVQKWGLGGKLNKFTPDSLFSLQVWEELEWWAFEEEIWKMRMWADEERRGLLSRAEGSAWSRNHESVAEFGDFPQLHWTANEKQSGKSWYYYKIIKSKPLLNTLGTGQNVKLWGILNR